MTTVDEPAPTVRDDDDRQGRTPLLRQGLPTALAQRFEVQKRLSEQSGQAELYLTRERATGLERVVKVYRPATDDRSADRIDPRVWGFLRATRSPNIVTVFETGTDEGLAYEITEFLAGGNLFKLRASRPTGLDPATLTEVVRQVTTALRECHRNGVVHRDIKPSNILIRTLDPIQVALVDFGISSIVPDGELISRDTAGSPPYTPPEFLAAKVVSTSNDWWALGITVVELATGQRLFGDVADDTRKSVVRERLAAGPISVPIADPRLRRLCRGLLTQDRSQRWGIDKVTRWLAGEDPSVAAFTSLDPPTSDPDRSIKPFVYLGSQYRDPAALAISMVESWNSAAAFFFGTDSGNRKALADWMTQFPPRPEPAAYARGGPLTRRPADVRLLRLIRWMAPTAPPLFRYENITRQRLAELAQLALEPTNAADGRTVLLLWAHGLLPMLATGLPASGLGGGRELLDVHRRWETERSNWAAAARGVDDGDARAELERIEADPTRLVAIWLWAATATDTDRDRLGRDLAEAARSYRLAWFTRLVTEPTTRWVAFALRSFAASTARRIGEAVAAERAQREWERRNVALVEWSRRQARPQALGYAVAGAFVVGVFWLLLIGLSDAVQFASDSSIVDGWYASVASVAVIVTVECLLAWGIGRRYIDRYSLLNAGIIWVGARARSIAGRRLSLLVIAGVLGGIAAAAIAAPAVLPAVASLGVVMWAVRRYLAWRTEEAGAGQPTETERDGDGLRRS